MCCLFRVHDPLARVRRCARVVCCLCGVHGSVCAFLIAPWHSCTRVRPLCALCVGHVDRWGLVFCVSLFCVVISLKKGVAQCAHSTGIDKGSAHDCSVLLCASSGSLRLFSFRSRAPRMRHACSIVHRSGLGQRFGDGVRLCVLAAGTACGSDAAYPIVGCCFWWSILHGGLG